MADNPCSSSLLDPCLNSSAALRLKIAAIASILAACSLGVSIPLLARSVPRFHPDSDAFFVVKSFAAGVILATAFVHMLPDAFESLGNPCLSENPWAKFPFAGFVSMLAAILTLFMDFSATSFFENKMHLSHSAVAPPPPPPPPIAVAAAAAESKPDHQALSIPHSHHAHSAAPSASAGTATSQHRHRVISQVLELGIVAHSVIIGITLGTSNSPCTVRPLLAALTFHQFFEGVALGGCIAQAGYKVVAASVMAFFFSVTTPLGIGIGIGISKSYDENSPRALIVQGILDAMSAGILVYMSLVDLIATDFLSKRLMRNGRLQRQSYGALFLGAGLMSLLAYWA